MSGRQLGICLPVVQFGPERETPRWSTMRHVALSAEQAGYDILWVPDELLWGSGEEPPRGFWDCVSIAGAAAAVTSRIGIGTWVLSALHRNAGIIAKTAETLDEISGGRFVFGLGAGHKGYGARAFGLPEDKVVGRFEEALQVIVPLMRGGRASFEGEFHVARDLVQQPVGPRPNAIPLYIGGQRPRAQRLAAQHADTWSTFVEEKSSLEEFGPRLESFVAMCEEIGRDPAEVGRAAGLMAYPLEPAGSNAEYVSGSATEIADQLRPFFSAGYSQIDLMVEPGTPEAFEALLPVAELLKAG